MISCKPEPFFPLHFQPPSDAEAMARQAEITGYTEGLGLLIHFLTAKEDEMRERKTWGCRCAPM
jgi:hypothetical protein